MTWTGLAIDLDGSLERRCRTADLGAAYLGELLTMDAPLDRRARTDPLFVLDLCVLTIELSGARADA